MTKQKLYRVLITLAAVAVVLTLVWPHSFTTLLSGNEALIIACNEWTIAPDGTPDLSMHSYRIEADSPEYAQMKDVLSRYSYRKCLRTFVGNNVLTVKHPGVSLQLYPGENVIVFGGTAEIDVNTRIHRMGLFTSGRAQQLMEEIIAVLKDIPEETSKTNGGEHP